MHRLGLVLSLVLSLAAFAVIVDLLGQSTRSRDAQTSIVRVEVGVREMQSVASQAAVGHVAPAVARRIVDAQQAALDRELRDAGSHGDEGGHLARSRRAMARLAERVRWVINLTAVPRPDIGKVFATGQTVIDRGLVATRSIRAAAAAHDRAAQRSLDRARVGTGLAIALLFAAFAWFHRQSRRARAAAEHLAAVNQDLLVASQEEALTDALTGLRNRRALMTDVRDALAGATAERPVVLALFDLDGFKQYNDAFGHPSGDGLLARLGGRLAATVAGFGHAYRLGGDEFCVVASATAAEAPSLVALAASALAEEGSGFQVSCSYGVVVMPSEAATAESALLLADQRMYEHKDSRRPSPSRQSADVLLSVLAERDARLRDHTRGVAQLACRTAVRLGLDDREVERVRLGAELHDIGKAAIPEAILDKTGPLDDAEWAFMRRHTMIGERIVLSAPSLAPVAELIRSSHERIDGTGYPDRLAGDAIPLGARIISVCDAYEAMISLRPYRKPLTPTEALAELRRCAGTQFDARVVEAFAAARRDLRARVTA